MEDDDNLDFPYVLNESKAPERLGERSQWSKLEMALSIVQRSHPLHKTASVYDIIPGIAWLNEAFLWDKFDQFERRVKGRDGSKEIADRTASYVSPDVVLKVTDSKQTTAGLQVLDIVNRTADKVKEISKGTVEKMR